MMHKMCGLHKASWILVLVGALNWGLVGLFQLNLVSAILGGFPLLERLVYVLVGVAAVLMLMKQSCKACQAGGGMMKKEEGMKKEEPRMHEGGQHGGQSHGDRPEGGNMPPSGGM